MTTIPPNHLRHCTSYVDTPPLENQLRGQLNGPRFAGPGDGAESSAAVTSVGAGHKRTWLRKLKLSARNCSRTFSRIAVVGKRKAHVDRSRRSHIRNCDCRAAERVDRGIRAKDVRVLTGHRPGDELLAFLTRWLPKLILRAGCDQTFFADRVHCLTNFCTRQLSSAT